MRRLTSLIPILIAVVCMFLFIYNDLKQQSALEKISLEDANLHFSGVVERIDHGNNFHDYGIVRLRIIRSNVPDYDPRGKQEFYFCIIKNGKAEIYDHAGNTFIGDTLVYNTKEKTGARIRNGIKTEEGSIGINADPSYYNYIQQKTIFK